MIKTTLNPALHKPKFINKLEYISDGIIKLWDDSEGAYEQEKYIQGTKPPLCKPSSPHHLIVNDVPPYFKVIKGEMNEFSYFWILLFLFLNH